MVFSIPSYLCCGDRPKKPYDARAQGTSFLVSRPKTGHNPDALFDKEFRYMWNGERGGNSEELQRKEQKAAAARNLTSNGFAYTSRTKRGEGLGSYFGCFQTSPPVHIPEHPEKNSQRVARREILPRPIFTSPGPKGGYGYANLSITPVGNDYIATYYDQRRINARREREEWRKRMPPEPFKPCGRRGFTFDEALATGVSRCYMMTTPFKEKRPEKVFVRFHIDHPWRPAGYVEDKPTAMEYWEDPYRGYDPRIPAADYVKKPTDANFKPSSRCDHFWYTQSIVFKRI